MQHLCAFPEQSQWGPSKHLEAENQPRRHQREPWASDAADCSSLCQSERTRSWPKVSAWWPSLESDTAVKAISIIVFSFRACAQV